MSAFTLRDTPMPSSIFLNQARSILFHQKWELLFFGVVTFLLHFGSVYKAHEAVVYWGRVPWRTIMLFNKGAIGPGVLWLFLLFSAFWAIRTWEGFNTSDRSIFLSLPAERTRHQLIRAAAGAAIFIAAISGSWLLGATIAEIIVPGHSWFTWPPSNGSGWIISILGICNIYLYATILALMFRRPEVWFLVWIPATLIMVTTIIILSQLNGLLEVLEVVLFWPFGVLAGLGFPHMEGRPPWSLPELGVVLMWMFILSVGVYLAARSHRED